MGEAKEETTTKLPKLMPSGRTFKRKKKDAPLNKKKSKKGGKPKQPSIHPKSKHGWNGVKPTPQRGWGGHSWGRFGVSTAQQTQKKRKGRLREGNEKRSGLTTPMKYSREAAGRMRNDLWGGTVWLAISFGEQRPLGFLGPDHLEYNTQGSGRELSNNRPITASFF